MITPDNNFDFDALKAQFAEMSEQVERYKNEAQRAEKRTEEAERKILTAENLAKEADKKYKEALELKKGQYQELIHDLFQEPQNTLINRMQKESMRSFLITMITAIGSIVIGFLISMYFQNQSTRASQDLIKKMESNLETTGQSVTKLDAVVTKMDKVVDAIWKAAADINVKKIVGIIAREKKGFNDYPSKNDVVLMYKVQASKEIPDVKYGELLIAFRSSTIIKEEFAPTSEEQFKKWDAEYLELCKKAVDQLEKKVKTFVTVDRRYDSFTNSNVFIGNTNTSSSNRILSNSNVSVYDAIVEEKFAKLYNTYKSEGDETDYRDLGWSNSTNLTYADLIRYLKTRIEAIEKRIDYNN